MDKLRNSTHQAFAAFACYFPGNWNDGFEEMKRLGFFKNAYHNVRKAYFDRRTTQSEFCFETNILCNRRSVYWRATMFDMRKTALQNKLTLNNYSSNGKQTAERLQLHSKWIVLWIQHSVYKSKISVVEDNDVRYEEDDTSKQAHVK